MNKEELIIGFFEKGYCCDLDEVKNTCLGLLKENQELKKQLEATEEILETHMKKWKAMENQQKEFIDYMKKTIGKLECDDVDDEDLKGYLLQRIDTFKEILQKYKEINHIAEVDKIVGGKE